MNLERLASILDDVGIYETRNDSFALQRFHQSERQLGGVNFCRLPCPFDGHANMVAGLPFAPWVLAQKEKGPPSLTGLVHFLVAWFAIERPTVGSLRRF
jgi:hypothetical protein